MTLNPQIQLSNVAFEPPPTAYFQYFLLQGEPLHLNYHGPVRLQQTVLLVWPPQCPLFHPKLPPGLYIHSCHNATGYPILQTLQNPVCDFSQQHVQSSCRRAPCTASALIGDMEKISWPFRPDLDTFAAVLNHYTNGVIPFGSGVVLIWIE